MKVKTRKTIVVAATGSGAAQAGQFIGMRRGDDVLYERDPKSRKRRTQGKPGKTARH